MIRFIAVHWLDAHASIAIMNVVQFGYEQCDGVRNSLLQILVIVAVHYYFSSKASGAQITDCAGVKNSLRFCVSTTEHLILVMYAC